MFFSQSEAAAEKEPEDVGVEQRKEQRRSEIKAEMWSQSRAHSKLQNLATGCQHSLYRSQDVRQEFPPS